MIRSLARVAGTIALLAVPLLTVAAAPAHADTVPLPVDVNCTFSYGVTVSPYGLAQTEINNYHGKTSCSENIPFIDAQACLSHATGGFVQCGPYHSCTSCSSAKSTGGAYGPVTDGSAWTVWYYTDLEAPSGQTWHGFPNACSVSGRWLYCAFQLTFAAGGQQTVDADSLAIAL